jgi:hypothetical protein
MVATDFNAGELTLAEAKDRVKALDVSHIDEYTSGVRESIKRIMTSEEEAVESKTEEKVDAPVVTESKVTTDDMPAGLSLDDKEDYKNFVNAKRRKRSR